MAAQRKTTRAQDYVTNVVHQNEAATAAFEHCPEGRWIYDDNFRRIAFTNACASFPEIDLNDVDAVEDRTDKYLVVCLQFAETPSIPSYALALGTSAQGIEAIFADNRHNREAQRAIARGVSKIETVLVNKVVDGKMNPVTAIFMLKNHFGYKDQSEIALRGSMINAKPSPKALEDKYKAITEIDE